LNHKKALVTKKFNNFFHVDLIENKKLLKDSKFLCKSRKNLFFKKNFIVVGDQVTIDKINLNDKTAIIENVIARKNLLDRPSVANISDIYIVCSVKEPKLNFSQVNKFLVKAESLKVHVSLILTKCDLISKDEINFLKNKFEGWGYPPQTLNIFNEIDIKKFINELKTKKCSILIGSSGVGKTTLLNKIIPNLNRKTAEISNKIKRGKNTTRNVELFELTNNSFIVDTPGFNIQNIDIQSKYIISLFPEINSQINKGQVNCRFRDCLHLNEPGCLLDKNFERYQYYRDLVCSSLNH